MPLIIDELPANLGRTIGSQHPDLVGHFNAGLSSAGFDGLEGELSPYSLPEACRLLYEGHDGAGEPLNLIPGYAFLSLEQALEEYRLQLEVEPVLEQPPFGDECAAQVRHMILLD